MTPLTWKTHILFNLHQFEQFLLHWMHHMKLYKLFENNRVISKDLRLQNVNWSYVTTHIMPMTPFIWRMHILFKPLSIWTIFVALVAPSKVLQHIFWNAKTIEWHPKISSSKMQTSHICHIMPMTPFTWKRHILLKPSSIWMIFVALAAK